MKFIMTITFESSDIVSNTMHVTTHRIIDGYYAEALERHLKIAMGFHNVKVIINPNKPTSIHEKQ